MPSKPTILSCLVFCVAVQASFAEPYRVPEDKLGDLTTDRPDYTESTSTVERGWTQLESTIAQYNEDFNGQAGSSVSWQHASTLARIGLLTNWELRLGWDGFSDNRSTDGVSVSSRTHGAGDANVGFKNKITEQESCIPSTAIIYFTNLPTGSSDITGETMEPGIKLGWSYDITSRLAITGNFNFLLANPDIAVIDSATGGPDASARERYVIFQPTISIGYSILENLGMFFEYYTSHHLSSHFPDEHYFDTGITFLVNKNLQLDVYTNLGLTKASQDLAVGSGISYRF